MMSLEVKRITCQLRDNADLKFCSAPVTLTFDVSSQNWRCRLQMSGKYFAVRNILQQI